MQHLKTEPRHATTLPRYQHVWMLLSFSCTALLSQILARYISACFNQFPFSLLCMLFCLLNRSTTRLPLWRMMTSYFTRRECESQCNATVTLTLRQQEQLAKYCLFLHVADIPYCIFTTTLSWCAGTASSTRWMPLDRYARSRARVRWRTSTRASSTPWHSTSSVRTNASVTPSAKSEWAPRRLPVVFRTRCSSSVFIMCFQWVVVTADLPLLVAWILTPTPLKYKPTGVCGKVLPA